MRIGTIRGAPSDRVLTREIKAAEIVRIPLSPTIAADAVELRRSGKADVFGATPVLGILPLKPCPAPRSCRAPLRWFAWRLHCRKVAQPQRKRRPSTSWWLMSKRQRRLGSPYRPQCLVALTRSSNNVAMSAIGT